MSKHSPGPWEIRRSGITVGSVVIGPSRKNVTKMSYYGEEARANARLIAAAPEMLEALKAVVAIADRKTIEFDAARAAIAKAEGRS